MINGFEMYTKTQSLDGYSMLRKGREDALYTHVTQSHVQKGEIFLRDLERFSHEFDQLVRWCVGRSAFFAQEQGELVAVGLECRLAVNGIAFYCPTKKVHCEIDCYLGRDIHSDPVYLAQDGRFFRGIWRYETVHMYPS